MRGAKHLRVASGAAGGRPVWQVVYIAPNEAIGAMVKDLLSRKGFLVMLRPAGIPHMGPAAPFEVLVPGLEAEEAHGVLTDLLSAGLRRRRA